MNYLKKIIGFAIIFAFSGLSAINLKLAVAIKNSHVNAVRDFISNEKLTCEDKKYYLRLAKEVLKLRRERIFLLDKGYHAFDITAKKRNWNVMGVILVCLGFSIGGSIKDHLTFNNFLTGSVIGASIKNDPNLKKFLIKIAASISLIVIGDFCFKKAEKVQEEWTSSIKQSYPDAIKINKLLEELE